MELTIRFIDQASGTVAEISQSLRTLTETSNNSSYSLLAAGYALRQAGDLMANAGKAGLEYFNDATDMASEYDKQARLALTQAKDTGVSLQELKTIGDDVGRSIPVALEDIQPTLFDIFSTVKTDGAGAKLMLEQFAEAAVAGNADIQDVARITLAELNAFGLGAEDVSRLLDIQFQMVKYGVGTYDQFASSMGLSIPTAKAAGQSVETLSGSLAFLTRNGLSVASATASVGRAFELLYSKKGQEGLKKLGIDIRDANGDVKQMGDIVTELAVNKGWAQLDEAQRKLVFQETFGQGTIQARRFFDVAIPNYEQLNEITGEMTNSTGAMAEAFATMMDGSAAKSALLRNQYELMKREVGDQLIPAKIKLMEILMKLIRAWEDLDPHLRSIIVKVAVVAAAFLAVVGPIIAFVGTIMMIVAGFSALGLSFATLGAIVGGIILAFVALAAVGYTIYTYWTPLSNLFTQVKLGLQAFWTTLNDITGEGVTDNGFVGFMQGIAVTLRDTVIPALKQAWDIFKSFAVWFGSGAFDVASVAFNAIVTAIQFVWGIAQNIYNWFITEFGPGFIRIFNSVRDNVAPVLDEIGQTVQKLMDAFAPLLAFIQFMWDSIAARFSQAVDEASLYMDYLKRTIIDNGLKAISDIAMDILMMLAQFIENNFNMVKNMAVDIWNFISRAISDAIAIMSNNIQLFLNILQGDWQGAWNNILNIIRSVWDLIGAVIRLGWETIKNLFTAGIQNVLTAAIYFVKAFLDLGSAMLGAFINGMGAARFDTWITLQWIFRYMLEQAFGFIIGFVNVGKQIVQGMINGIYSMKDAMYNAAKSVAQSAMSAVKSILHISSPSGVFMEYGRMTVLGFEEGLKNQLNTGGIDDYLGSLNPQFNVNNLTSGVQTQSQPDLEMMTNRIVAAIQGIKPLNVEELNLGGNKEEPVDFWTKVTYSGV
ncbi:MAG: phage tail tape measure protein [Chitinophagaceae bacterium]